MAVFCDKPLYNSLGRDVDSGGVALVGQPVLAPVPDLVALSVGLVHPVGVVVRVTQQRVTPRTQEPRGRDAIFFVPGKPDKFFTQFKEKTASCSSAYYTGHTVPYHCEPGTF
jgi:hypothetical protein